MQPQAIWCDGVLREGRTRDYGVHIELGFIIIPAEQKVKSVLVAFIYFIFIYLPSANLLYLR